MLTKSPGRRVTPRMLGLIFLIFGLVVGVPTMIFGSFGGAVQGFSTFAVLFGVVLFFLPSPAEEKTRP